MDNPTRPIHHGWQWEIKIKTQQHFPTSICFDHVNVQCQDFQLIWALVIYQNSNGTLTSCRPNDRAQGQFFEEGLTAIESKKETENGIIVSNKFKKNRLNDDQPFYSYSQ